MRPTEPLPLHHSWPLFERERLFELGRILGCPPSTLPTSDWAWRGRQEHARSGIGLWECDLSDDSLTWSAEVYDIFGLPLDSPVRRHEVVDLDRESSRAIMERLRAYAIKHRRGFTLDVEIQPAVRDPQWMRLIAAPICEGGRVVRPRGLAVGPDVESKSTLADLRDGGQAQIVRAIMFLRERGKVKHK